MTGTPLALQEAQSTSDSVDVSEFFGGEGFDEMFETLSPEEVDALSTPFESESSVSAD